MNFLLKKLISLTKQNLVLPFYHTVSDKPLPHIQNLYTLKSVTDFKNEIDYLTHNFQALTLQDLFALIHEEKELSRPSFFLTFDDGLKECYTTIAPILKDYNIKAAFFLNSAFVDNRNLFFRYKASLLIDEIKKRNNTQYTPEAILKIGYNERYVLDNMAEEMGYSFKHYLKTQQPYMTSEQVRGLISQGHYIGGHSVDHPLYADISLNEQLTQTQESVDFVQKKFDIDYRIFAFPFTDIGVSKTYFDKIVLDAFFTSGILENDPIPNVFRRLAMEKKVSSPANFMLKKYLRLWIKQKVGRGVYKRSTST